MLQKLQLLLQYKLDKNTKIFFAELIGTFIVIVFATGSVVLDAKLNGALGLTFIAIAPAVAVAIGVFILYHHLPLNISYILMKTHDLIGLGQHLGSKTNYPSSLASLGC